MPIIWERADGSLIIQRLADSYLARERREGETTEQAVARLAIVTRAKVPDWAGLTPRLVTEASMPTNRTKRHRWRLAQGQVVDDVTVPDPPHPKQALLDQIDQAPTLIALKSILKQIVKGA